MNTFKLTAVPNGNKYISWTIRILLMLMIVLFFAFSLDIFNMGAGQPLWRVLGAFLKHNIFTLALLLILTVSWRWEHIGGLLLLGVSVIMIFFFGGPTHLFDDARWVLTATPIPMGLLLLLNHFIIGRSR